MRRKIRHDGTRLNPSTEEVEADGSLEFQDSQHCIERPLSPLFPERDRVTRKEETNAGKAGKASR